MSSSLAESTVSGQRNADSRRVSMETDVLTLARKLGVL